MIKSEIDFLHRAQQTEQRQRVHNDFARRIYAGLGVQDAAFLEFPSGTGEGLAGDISRVLTATSTHLRKPLPDAVTLLGSWTDVLRNGEGAGFGDLDVLANADRNDDFPNGIIRISPFYLKAELLRRVGRITGQGGGNGEIVMTLDELLAHEDFHIWQYINNSASVLIDLAIAHKEEKGWLTAWNQTRTELDAREFAKTWIMQNGVTAI